MKRINIIIIVVIVLSIAAIALVTSNRYSTLEQHESAFAVADTSTVTKIFIADKKTNELLLERTEDGWLINGRFNANPKSIEMLLGTLKRIRVKAPVSLATHDNVIKRMATTGKKVEVYQMVYRINLFDKIKLFRHEKRTKVFYVGGATQDNLGTYALMEDGDRPYIIYLPSFRGYLSTRFSPVADDWKSHVLFNKKLADIKSVQLEFTRQPEESFRVDVKDRGGKYTLTALQTGRQVPGYDTLRMLNFLTSFRDLRYETRMNNIRSVVTIDSIINSPSLYELTLVDRKDDTTYVKMFEKKDATPEDAGLELKFISIDHDRFYGLANDGEDFVLMQYYTFDKVLEPLSHYKKED